MMIDESSRDPYRRQFWRRASLRGMMVAATLFALTLLTPNAHAGGGVGKVWTSDVTATEMTVNWSFPSKYRGTDFYVCAKHAGAWEGACDDANSHAAPGGFDARSLRLTGLDPGQEYKIKVISYNMMKNGKHDKQRKIGTNRLKTLSTNPIALADAAFWVSGSDAHSISVGWKFAGTGIPSGWRLCIKKRWSLTMLNGLLGNGCREAQGTVDNKSSFELPVSANSFTFSGLKPESNYKIYLIYESYGPTLYAELAEVRAFTAR